MLIGTTTLLTKLNLRQEYLEVLEEIMRRNEDGDYFGLRGIDVDETERMALALLGGATPFIDFNPHRESGELKLEEIKTVFCFHEVILEDGRIFVSGHDIIYNES